MKLKLLLGGPLSHLRYPAIITMLGISSGTMFAAATASDTAANYSGGGWGATPPNDGSGFGAWTVTINNANNPPYVGTYLDTSSAVATGGYSWATYANGTGDNGSISISRAFASGLSGSSSLFNQVFSFDLSSGGVGNGSGGPPNSDLSVEIGNAFLFQYLGTGSDNFTLNGNATTIGFSALSAGIYVSLAVSGALNSPVEAYTFSVSPFNVGSPLYTASGTFDSSALNTSSFNYLDQNTSGNGYFNNLNITSIVPEPSAIALLGLSGLATLIAIRRRN
ncbi:MAG TPA: PEP-CTERM sorting domain-containing protein [Verrucomicrobiae bacterium]